MQIISLALSLLAVSKVFYTTEASDMAHPCNHINPPFRRPLAPLDANAANVSLFKPAKPAPATTAVVIVCLAQSPTQQMFDICSCFCCSDLVQTQVDALQGVC